jgi:membrane protein implicated in regulation of membrane protease activity
LLNTLAATAATDYIASHTASAAVAAEAAVASYSTAYGWTAVFFAVGAVLAAVLFRRRGQGLSLSGQAAPAASAEPVIAH